MTRKQAEVGILVILAVIAACGIAGIVRAPIVRAQTTTPFLEGTANCTAVTFWFADGVYRLPQGKFYGLHPRLTLYNPQQVEQTAIVRVHSTQGSILLQDIVEPINRRVIDIGPLIGAAADFSVEVEFAALGAADLKIWSAANAYVPVMPLAVCR